MELKLEQAGRAVLVLVMVMVMVRVLVMERVLEVGQAHPRVLLKAMYSLMALEAASSLTVISLTVTGWMLEGR